MPNLIRPKVLEKTTEIVTKEGEVKIHLSIDLNLNISSNGVQVTGANASAQKIEDDETDWAIPDFKMGGNIDFGEEKK